MEYTRRGMNQTTIVTAEVPQGSFIWTSHGNINVIFIAFHRMSDTRRVLIVLTFPELYLLDPEFDYISANSTDETEGEKIRGARCGGNHKKNRIETSTTGRIIWVCNNCVS